MDLNTVEELRRPLRREDVWPLGPQDAVLAGGTWLFSEPQSALRRLVDITALGWPAVEVGDDGLTLAATATVANVSRLSAELPQLRPEWTAAPLLHQCCTAFLASHKVWRTMTIGGNICLSFPAGAMISLVAGLDGTVTVWRADGADYTLPISEFVTGPATNVLAPGDVLRSIHLPDSALRGRTAYRKLAPSPLGRSGNVVTGRLDASGFALSITASTVRPYVFRFPGVPEPGELREAHAGIPDDAWTIDAHGDPDWRRAVSLVLAQQIRSELACD